MTVPERVDLVILTDAFPFGRSGEAFLEPEIEVLARHFGKIWVLPSRRVDGMRSLPPNAELVEMPWLDGIPGATRRRAIWSREGLGVVARSLSDPAARAPFLRGLRAHHWLLAENVVRGRQLETWLTAGGHRDAVVYDYWFENSTLALALLRRRGVVSVAVARAHRWDLYDDDWSFGAVPFRGVKMAELDAVFAISDHGATYLGERAPRWANKVRTSRLGVRRQTATVPDGEPPVVLSCSHVIERKRIHLIPEALARMERPVHWIHAGGGPELSRVEEAARRLPAHVTWELPGEMSNSEVLDLYRTRPVRALLSLSGSEGIPVSMMEALSFGVPVVSVSVQGIPELVTPESGTLLPLDAPPEAVARALTDAMTPGRFSSDAVRRVFRDRFDAEVNFSAFAEDLLDLRRGGRRRRG